MPFSLLPSSGFWNFNGASSNPANDLPNSPNGVYQNASTGHLYQVIARVDPNHTNQLNVQINKSIDRGQTWTDATGAIPFGNLSLGAKSVFFGGIIYLVVGKLFSGGGPGPDNPALTQLWLYNTNGAADSWSQGPNPPSIATQNNAQTVDNEGDPYHFTVAARANGNLLFGYCGAFELVMGTGPWARPFIAELSGGAWSAGVQIPGTAGQQRAFSIDQILTTPAGRFHAIIQGDDYEGTGNQNILCVTGNTLGTFTATQDIAPACVGTIGHFCANVWSPVGFGAVFADPFDSNTVKIAVPSSFFGLSTGGCLIADDADVPAFTATTGLAAGGPAWNNRGVSVSLFFGGGRLNAANIGANSVGFQTLVAGVWSAQVIPPDATLPGGKFGQTMGIWINGVLCAMCLSQDGPSSLENIGYHFYEPSVPPPAGDGCVFAS